MQAILFVGGLLLVVVGTLLTGLALIVDPRKDYGGGRVFLFCIGVPACCSGLLLPIAAARL